MPADMPSIFPSGLYSIVLTAFLALFPTIAHSVTLESDSAVLSLLKRSIDPNTIPISSFLDTWNLSADPCESTSQFLGILCTYPEEESRQRIVAIDLDSFGYDGVLTQSIGNLTELTTLNLGRNKFRGPIPDSISGLRKLTTLSMSGNFLSGSIPRGITMLKKLESVDLSYNTLSGSIPAKLSGLRRLIHLRLSHNELSGRIPDLTASWQLDTLELDNNQLYGNLPNFPASLRTLSLSHNTLSGHITPIGKLKNLKLLDLSNNRLTGSIRQQILKLSQVVHINVSMNLFTGIEVAKFVGIETHLQDFDAHGNMIRSRLPANLVTVSNLTSVNLARNDFTGPIPREYGVKVVNSWKSLFLDHNFLTGDLPQEFSNASIRMKGSLANNCLRCPTNVTLCLGGQRSTSECVGLNDGSE
ncbi:LRR receptor-like serine/threonine-protein kinase RCH1 [Pistacia vera]|uniref:LRR receptor-like serine/threonine-protein kinase RCH1 n=1 Tax=Pistacia vera TaxID=55513 RepID=UPI001263A22D|nr:LRR receptor-like serine/threonine-protein kinase RCH1 [Pistacia vera]